MNSESNLQVQVTHKFDASPERVFDAWINPEIAGQWLFSVPAGQMVRVEIDARVRGSFIFVDRRDGQDIEHVGEYLEIARPHRLVFTFRVPKFSDVSTKVTIDIVADGTGCQLTLTHDGVLPDYLTRTRQGWTTLLERLAGLLV